MKLLINGKYEEIGFWSWMKCQVLVGLAIVGLIWAGSLFLTLLLYEV